MKTLLKIFFTIFILQFTICISAFSQNLVPNPSFEEYTFCPTGFDQIENAIGWISCTPSCDLYNSCSISQDVSIPDNNFGYQMALGENCKGYSGIYTYIQNLNYREYMSAKLDSQLIIGKKYFISFYVSLADDINCGIDKIGIVFSTTLTYYSGTIITNFRNNAHLYSSSIITDKINWTRIYGTFIADSSYKYISIGNFFDNNNTDTIKLDNMNCVSYYFIDGICVSTDSLLCATDSNPCSTGILKNNKSNFIYIYPNPCNKFINIENNYYKNYKIEIYNITGQLMLEKHINNKKETIFLTNFNSGIYFIKLLTRKEMLTKKLVILK